MNNISVNKQVKPLVEKLVESHEKLNLEYLSLMAELKLLMLELRLGDALRQEDLLLKYVWADLVRSAYL